MVRITFECTYVVLFLLGFLHGVDLARWLLDHRSLVSGTLVTFLLEVVHLLAVVTDGALLVIRDSRLSRLPAVVMLSCWLSGSYRVDTLDGVNWETEIRSGFLKLHNFVAHLDNVVEVLVGQMFLGCRVQTPIE